MVCPGCGVLVGFISNRGIGFRLRVRGVQGLGFRIREGFRVLGVTSVGLGRLGFRVQGLELRRLRVRVYN